MTISPQLEILGQQLQQLQEIYNAEYVPTRDELEVLAGLIDQTYLLRELRNAYIFDQADRGISTKDIARTVNLPPSRVGQVIANKRIQGLKL